MEKVSQKAWQQINKEHIKPEPKYKFLAKNSVFWTGATLTLILGTLSFGVIFYFLNNQEWDLYLRSADGSFWQIFFLVTPYFWLIALIAFILLAYYNLKHTRFGYRYKLKHIIITYFLISIVLGLGLYQLGLAETLERTFVNRVPLYKELVYHRYLPMQAPRNGLLAGEIVTRNDNNIEIIDFKKQSWQVDISSCLVHPMVQFISGEKIRLLGDVVDKKHFKAQKIAPLLKSGPRPGKDIHRPEKMQYIYNETK